jgi:hypothetical protein
MKTFKLYYENLQMREDLKDLMQMIKNPNQNKVQEYGGGDEYVNMLRNKAANLINRIAADSKKEDNEQHSRLSKLSDKELYNISKERDLDSMVEISDRRITNRDEIIDLLSIATPVYGKENQEEDAQDRCKRKADQVYGKKTSAYKSGAIVRCRKGKIWKKK